MKTHSIEERDHHIVHASWRGYIRTSALVRRMYELGAFLDEGVVAKNGAVMVYNPLSASPEER